MKSKYTNTYIENTQMITDLFVEYKELITESILYTLDESYTAEKTLGVMFFVPTISFSFNRNNVISLGDLKSAQLVNAVKWIQREDKEWLNNFFHELLDYHLYENSFEIMINTPNSFVLIFRKVF